MIVGIIDSARPETAFSLVTINKYTLYTKKKKKIKNMMQHIFMHSDFFLSTEHEIQNKI